MLNFRFIVSIIIILEIIFLWIVTGWENKHLAAQLRVHWVNFNKIADPTNKGVSKVKHIDASLKNIGQLPKEISQYQRLETLNLMMCGLYTIPEEIGQLSNLKELELSSNDLIKIPEELIKLQQLEYLDLSGNQLNSLPKHLISANLKTLDLSGNQLKKAPDYDYKIDTFQLQYLNLNSNPIRELWLEPSQFPNLRKLELINTKIAARNIRELQLKFPKVEIISN